MSHNEVRLTDHARSRIERRFGIHEPGAQLELAELLVRVGTYIGPSSHDPHGHLLRAERGTVLVEYAVRGIIVVSAWPPEWLPMRGDYGWWMRHPDDPTIDEIEEQLRKRFKVSRR